MNKLIPWQRYLSDIAHKYVGYPDEEEGGDETMIINVNSETGAFDKTYNEILEAAATQNVVAIIDQEDEVYLFPVLSVNDNGGYFVYLLGVALVQDVLEPIIMTASADTVNDYPVLAS